MEQKHTPLEKNELVGKFVLVAKNMLSLEGEEVNADNLLNLVICMLVFAMPQKFHSNLV